MGRSLGLVVLALALALAVGASAGECDFFAKHWGGSQDEIGYAIARTADGGWVVAGSTTSFGAGAKDVLVVKFNSEGNRVWAKALGGTGYDEARAVVVLPDGSIVIAGATENAGAGGTNVLLSKFSSTGTHLWSRVWGRSGDDGAYALIRMSDGRLAVTGYSQEGVRYEVLLAVFDATGNTVTYNVLGELLRSYVGRALVQVPDGRLVVAGAYYWGADQSNILVMRFGSNLSLQAAKQMYFGSDDEVATTIATAYDGGFLVGGSINNGAPSGFVMKLTADLNGSWARIIPAPGLYYKAGVESVIEVGYDDVLAVGHYRGPDPNVPTLFYDDVLLCKWSAGGALRWTRTFGERFVDELGYAVVEDPQLGLQVAGYAYTAAGGGQQLLLAKTDRTGRTCLGEEDGPTPTTSNITWSSLTPANDIDTVSTAAWSPTIATIGNEVVEACAPTTWTVCPYGDPDFETIQEALDAATNGDTILLCCDVSFYGDGNWNLDFHGKAVTLRSECGDPERCDIDCYNPASYLTRGFRFHCGEGPCSVVEGITIRNGFVGVYPSGTGGAILCENCSSPTIGNCRIIACHASNGGGIYADACSAPTMTQCVLSGNHATFGGGAHGAFELTHCTIAGNYAYTQGGGIWGAALPMYSIIRANCAPVGAGPDWWGDGGCTVICCNDYDPAKLDGFGTCSVMCFGNKPNINADPLFCDLEHCNHAPTECGDYHLCWASPCATGPGECGLIGALPAAECAGCKGDMNCDGQVDFGDINPFVLALSSPDTWENTFPCCPILNGDINGDCLVDFADINPFVACLSSGVPKPCPPGCGTP
jgi:hypothetical protein